jgi:heavy metal translocating P-type ATPase
VGPDGESDVAVEQIIIGDTLHVRPGDVVPVDGHVLEGASDLDTSRLTGEPLPRPVSAGSAVMSGMLNGSGAFTMRADALAGASQYAKIVELVRSAESSKSPLQRLADRYARWFTPATLAVCVVAWLLSGDAARVLAVLVVATPCPLILATPVAFIGGINRAARRQIIVRSASALERLASATVAVFDKTGTITEGRPRVGRIASRDGVPPADVLRLAAAVEQRAGHLLARSIVDAARDAHGTLPSASEVREAPGRGVEGMVEGKHVIVGSRGFVSDRLGKPVRALAGDDLAVALRAFVAVDGEVEGSLDFEDSIRPSARGLVRALPSLGFSRTVMLSGDSDANARAIAAEVGITMVEGDLFPEDKVKRVAELSGSVGRVMMVGDGTNDAPALSRADVGIALAGHGGGITAESADVVILIDDLGRVGEAIRISKRTLSIAKQSIGVGLALSGIGMIVAALGYLPPIAGALTQEAIDVAVILNALRASRSPVS